MSCRLFVRKEAVADIKPKTETPEEREKRFQQTLKDNVLNHFVVWERLADVKQITDINFLRKITPETEKAPCVVDAAKERIKELKNLRKTNLQARPE